MKKIVLILILFSSMLYAGKCYVKVTHTNGNPYKGVKVKSCINGKFTKILTTNINGEVTINWKGKENLHHVYIDGKKYGKCLDGKVFLATKSSKK